MDAGDGICSLLYTKARQTICQGPPGTGKVQRSIIAFVVLLSLYDASKLNVRKVYTTWKEKILV